MTVSPASGGVAAVRVGTAAVWLCFGLLFKVLGLLPRHRDIVAAVLGDALAGPATVLVGLAETGMAVWILSGWRPYWCVAAQTAALTAMNALELALAKDLLLAPVPMIAGNVLFLGAGWWAAMKTTMRPSAVGVVSA